MNDTTDTFADVPTPSVYNSMNNHNRDNTKKANSPRNDNNMGNTKKAIPKDRKPATPMRRSTGITHVRTRYKNTLTMLTIQGHSSLMNSPF